MKDFQNINPPRLAVWILRKLLRNDLLEEVEGDLEEKFFSVLSKSNKRKAKLNYWKQVLLYMRPFAIKKTKSNYSKYSIMFIYTIKLAFRNFLKHKSSFLINLGGLSTGLACVIMIYLWVNDELQMDKFHKLDKQLHQVLLNHEESGKLNTQPSTQGILADALESEVPEVLMAVEDTDPTWFGDNFSLENDKKNIKAIGKFSGDQYFEMFSFELLHGDASIVLDDKKSVVISESLARKFYQNPEYAIGETLTWNLLQFNDKVKVTGVFKDLPNNSSESFDFIIPFQNFKDLVGDGMNWGNYNAMTYATLREGTDLASLNERLGPFVKKKAEGSNVNVFMRPYSDQHLYNKYENGKLVGGRIFYVRLFSLIALFILGIACINFMNLSTAKASRRLKEVGVKKAIGADRKLLIFQYLGESIMLSLIALVVALLIVILLLPQFNVITGKYLTLSFDPIALLIMFGITLITGLLSGSYPALYLSSFQPTEILRGKLQSKFGELWIRRGLVVFQFSLSVILIVSVLVVHRQIEFAQTTPLGYERDNVILFPKEGKANDNLDLMLSELRNIPGVAYASASNHKVVQKSGFTTGVEWEGKNPEVETRFENVASYYDFIEAMGFEIVNGRSFSREFNNEGNSVLFNETAIAEMGFTNENAVGRTIKVWGNDVTIIGVVKDFQMQSVHDKVSPVLFRFDPTFLPNMVVKMQEGQEKETLARLNKFYEDFNPGYAFQFEFMDVEYQSLYQAEEKVAYLSKYFAILAILISCLGLFGLTSFTAERRSKEIGIRKILGSGNWRILVLLSTDFTKMVVSAIVIGLPISYFLVRQWLDEFALRIELQFWFFAVAGIAALAIAWLTVGIQTVKVSKINPVDQLRNE
ncbi:MAG: ABC transporter permease [bacterium]|nr:ABC transporter permease [bacterium]